MQLLQFAISGAIQKNGENLIQTMNRINSAFFEVTMTGQKPGSSQLNIGLFKVVCTHTFSYLASSIICWRKFSAYGISSSFRKFSLDPTNGIDRSPLLYHRCLPIAIIHFRFCALSNHWAKLCRQYLFRVILPQISSLGPLNTAGLLPLHQIIDNVLNVRC